MKSSLIAIAMAFDLGFDELLIFKVDPATGKMTPNEPALAQTPAGGGLRHLAIYPCGKFVFASNEMEVPSSIGVRFWAVK